MIRKIDAKNRRLEDRQADVVTERRALKVSVIPLPKLYKNTDAGVQKRIEELEQELERSRTGSRGEKVHRSSGVAAPIPAGNNSDTPPIKSKGNTKEIAGRYGDLFLSHVDLPSTSVWPPSENPLPKATDSDDSNISIVGDLIFNRGDDSPASTLSRQLLRHPVNAPHDPPAQTSRPSTPQKQKMYPKKTSSTFTESRQAKPSGFFAWATGGTKKDWA